MIVKNTNYCFACGGENPIGLKLKFAPTSNGVETKFVPSQLYEGFQNIIHGGIIATVLDEAIAWACRRFGVDAVTGELTVRYKKPLFTNSLVHVVGLIEAQRGKLLYGKAYIKDADGTIIASATAKMVRANQ